MSLERPRNASTIYTSAISLRRRMVDRVAAAAGVLYPECQGLHSAWDARQDQLSWLIDLRDGPCATGDGLVAALALPDANGLTLDGVLAAESADVSGVLGDFHLLHLLTEGGTVSGSLLVVVHGPWNFNSAQECFEAVRGCVRTGYRIYR